MIWIVGNKGMLGSELTRTFEKRKTEFIGSDREVDFLDYSAISQFSFDNHVDIIINCAAYTAVDKAEDEPELCRRLNIDGPVNLARLAQEKGYKFIHISTDYVFSGNGSKPYKEEDPVDPQGVYGRTKAEGESGVLKVYPKAIIVRTAWLYGEFGSNFVYTMLRLMRNRSEINIVGDQIGSPTWAKDLADALYEIINDTSGKSGIYHYTNSGCISWFEFAVAIFQEGIKIGILENYCSIKKITTAKYPTKAKRPSYSVLSKDKIEKDFSVVIPDWRLSLERFLNDVKVNIDILSFRIH
ncbi:MAG: dTDP-4-dehydrorhamnose reductase [Mobilitalea sp.]